MKRTAEAAGATKRRLQHAARDLFYRQGYSVTSVSEVVAEAGLTKGAFYHHFASKEEILRDLHDDFVSDQFNRIQAVVDQQLPVDETIRGLVREILVSGQEHRESIGVFLRERRYLSAPLAEQVKQKRDEFERLVTETIQRGMAEGAFAEVTSPRLLAFGIIGMCAWSHEWFDPEGAVSADDVASMYADVLLRGLDRRDT